jgi:SAM-dependent methyltransferase
MSHDPASSEWAASRGEKWLASIAGTEAMLAPIDQPLLAALRLTEPCAIADIGCGGGATTIELLRHAPPGSTAHGFDISPALIAAARKRQPDIAFHVADVAKTPPPQLYDRLTSRFGIMFFDDPRAAFANLARWLKPGGRFAFAAWDYPAANPWIKDVGRIASQFVELPPLDPAAPGPFRYAEASVLLTLLEQSGFTGLNVANWQGPLAIGGGLPPAEAAAFALGAFSSFNELLTAAGEPVCREAHRALTAHFSERQHNGTVQLDASVHIFTGVRSPTPK